MRFFSIDYSKDRGSRGLVNRGFFLHGTPRLIPWCRLFGHRPVVDGVNYGNRGRRSRWVVCDRCGVRPDPQGQLDNDLVLGQPYTGPYGPPRTPRKVKLGEPTPDLSGAAQLPGPWPGSPTGAVGGQLVLGRQISAFSADVTIGCAGSEHPVSAHLTVSPLFGLYLHTDSHLEGLRRRLNPVGYDERETSISLGDGSLRWRLWAKENEYSSATPRWRDGSVNLSILDRWLGPKRYSYEDRDYATGLVRLPHGDEQLVTLTLKRQSHGRARGRKKLSWVADWANRDGIPVGDDRATAAAAVKVRDGAVADRTWPAEALAAIAVQVTEWRAHRGYGPIPDMVAPGE